MKITSVETIHLSKGITVHVGPIQWLWVRIHTDEGLTGLGETYPSVIAEKAVVHRLAPLLIGRNPLEIDRLWADMFLAVSYAGWAGAEMRAISAIDIALWDLFGKAAGQPIYKLLVAHPVNPFASTTPATTAWISHANPPSLPASCSLATF